MDADEAGRPAVLDSRDKGRLPRMFGDDGGDADGEGVCDWERIRLRTGCSVEVEVVAREEDRLADLE